MENKAFAILLVLLVFRLLIAPSPYAQEPSPSIRLTGLVTNSQGCPIANADVSFLSSHESDLIVSARSDAFGRFQIDTQQQKLVGTLFVSSAVDWMSKLVPIKYGINLLDDYIYNKKTFELSTAKLKNSNLFDVGTVGLNLRYTPIRLKFSGNIARKLFGTDGDDIYYRLTDFKGRIASQSKVNRGLNRQAHSLELLLPDGQWSLEIRRGDQEWLCAIEKVEIFGQTELITLFTK